MNVKEVSIAKFDSKDRVLVATLTQACEKCYVEDNLTVQKVRGSIMDLATMPTMEQIQSWKPFQVGPAGKCVVDDIHGHWVSYLGQFGALAKAPYSQFQPTEG